jgi:hypothetical protein
MDIQAMNPAEPLEVEPARPESALSGRVNAVLAALRASGHHHQQCFVVRQVSYMILQRVSPVTHSIGNCVKRVAVIVASVIVFRNPMPIQNSIGGFIGSALLLKLLRICVGLQRVYNNNIMIIMNNINITIRMYNINIMIRM